jgi:hypothetical protein
MKKQEQRLLLIIGAALVIGGVVSVQFKGGTKLSAGQDRPATDTARIVNSSLKRGLANAWHPEVYDGDWIAPHWSLESVGVTPLRANHPLFRRPAYIGQNRHKVMTEGWGGWYYNPPSESYF